MKTQTPQTEKFNYGKIIDGQLLEYKDKLYQIRYVTKSALVLKTNELYGKYGDEFSLDFIR